MSSEYESDVAISFLQQDEELAVDIADRFRDRVNIFICSEQQKELIANDSVDAFSRLGWKSKNQLARDSRRQEILCIGTTGRPLDSTDTGPSACPRGS